MRRILTLFFVLCSIVAFAQPANDDCDNATTIVMTNGSGTSTGTNVAATPSTLPMGTPPSCFVGSPVGDIWFKFNTGTFTDYEITVSGPVNSNPEFEVWRFITTIPNFCTTAGIPIDCQTTSPGGGTTISTIVQGVTANSDLYIRVSNWNSGGGGAVGSNFTVNVNQYVPPVILDNTQCGNTNNSCVGKIYDSGGPTGDYGPLENCEYTICPTDPHTCIIFDLVSYQVEPNSTDGLEFYSGTTVNQNNRVTPCGNPFAIQDSCVTIRFRSDGTNQAAGFELDWQCATTCPPAPVQSDCYTATNIPAIPYNFSGSTCGASSNYDASDACGSSYMNGEDYSFQYTSAGNECLNINVTNTSPGAEVGLFVMDGCPLADATQCIAKVESDTGNPEITTVKLENPGTYYIVISSVIDATNFDISIQSTPCAIDVDDNITPDSLIRNIASQGVIVRNAVLNCNQGSFGTFTGGITDGSQVLDGGIILTTGRAVDAENASGLISSIATGPGDSLLQAITGQSFTVDACVLEFDIYVPGDELKFDYVFAAEDYHPTVGAPNIFYDVFAFTLTGPGIIGSQNLAVLPSPPALPNAQINSNIVNSTLNAQFYRNNNTANGFAYNADAFGFEGHTTVLEASATGLIPCNWYHLRAAIADGIDFTSDAGVLIGANSLASNTPVVSAFSSSNFLTDTATAGEGCHNATFEISLVQPLEIGDSSMIILDIAQIPGHATEGADYVNFPDSVKFFHDRIVVYFPNGIINVITTGDLTSYSLTLVPIQDNEIEGVEPLMVYAISPLCPNPEPYDSAIVLIFDEFTTSLPDTLLLCGQPETLPLTGSGIEYVSWSTSFGLTDSTAQQPIVGALVDTTYKVVASNGVCFDTLSIFVKPYLVETAGDTILCDGEATQLDVQTNIPGFTYAWTPTDGLSCTDCPDPTVQSGPIGVTDYVVAFTSADGQCSNVDTVTVEVLPIPTADINGDTTICEGSSVLIGNTPEAGLNYIWVNLNTGDTISNSLDFTVSPDVTTSYQVTADNGLCFSVSSPIEVAVSGIFDVTTNSDEEIDLGNSVDVNTTITQLGSSAVGALSYVWSPVTALSNPAIPNPVATPTETIVYTLTVTSEVGCTQSVSFQITVNTPFFNMPNAFTPNGDGENDHFKVLSAPNANYEILSFRVFNRWGELVYDSVNQTGWDGTVNGSPATQDTYIYQVSIVKPDGVQEEFTGHVLLIR